MHLCMPLRGTALRPRRSNFRGDSSHSPEEGGRQSVDPPPRGGILPYESAPLCCGRALRLFECRGEVPSLYPFASLSSAQVVALSSALPFAARVVLCEAPPYESLFSVTLVGYPYEVVLLELPSWARIESFWLLGEDPLVRSAFEGSPASSHAIRYLPFLFSGEGVIRCAIGSLMP